MDEYINKPFTLQVLKKDIKNGKQDQSRRCPLARAFRRCMHKREVSVTPDHVITYTGSSQNPYILLPTWLQKWIVDFDEGDMDLAKPFKKRVVINEDNCLVTVK